MATGRLGERKVIPRVGRICSSLLTKSQKGSILSPRWLPLQTNPTALPGGAIRRTDASPKVVRPPSVKLVTFTPATGRKNWLCPSPPATDASSDGGSGHSISKKRAKYVSHSAHGATTRFRRTALNRAKLIFVITQEPYSLPRRTLCPKGYFVVSSLSLCSAC